MANERWRSKPADIILYGYAAAIAIARGKDAGDVLGRFSRRFRACSIKDFERWIESALDDAAGRGSDFSAWSLIRSVKRYRLKQKQVCRKDMQRWLAASRNMEREPFKKRSRLKQFAAGGGDDYMQEIDVPCFVMDAIRLHELHQEAQEFE